MVRLVDFVSEDIRSFLHLCPWKVYLICVTVLRFLRCYWNLILLKFVEFWFLFWLDCHSSPSCVAVFVSPCLYYHLYCESFCLALFIMFWLFDYFQFCFDSQISHLDSVFTSCLSLLVFDYLQLGFVPTALSSPINIYMLWTNSPKNSFLTLMVRCNGDYKEKRSKVLRIQLYLHYTKLFKNVMADVMDVQKSEDNN